MIRIIICVITCVFSPILWANSVQLKASHPETYVVKKGDTLWDIAGIFLDDPTKWRTLWQDNPQISTPDLIYPGDRLTLVMVNGVPQLVKKPYIKKTFIKKTPTGRVQAKQHPVPAVELSHFLPYLQHTQVVDDDWLAEQPLVLEGDSESIHYISGDVLYINKALPLGTKYGVYRPARELERDDGTELGRELVLVSTGQVTRSDSVSEFTLLSNYQETKSGYRLLPLTEDVMLSAYFSPVPATTDAEVKVIALGKDIREMGKLDVVYLDRGSDDGVNAGDIFDVYRSNPRVVLDSDDMPVQHNDETTYDRFSAAVFDDSSINTPDYYQGKVMVFKSFDQVSLALILKSRRPIRIADQVYIPTSTSE